MNCEGDVSSTCIVSYESGHVLLFDCKTRTILNEYRVFSSPVISLATTMDLSSFVCGSSKNEIAFYTSESGLINMYQTPNNGVLSLSVRKDNRLLAVGGKDGTYVFDEMF